MTIEEDDILDTKVEMTIIGGKIVYNLFNEIIS